MKEKDIFNFNNIGYSKFNTHVLNSYLITDKKQIKEYVLKIIDERKKLNYPITRTPESYVREWIGHNKLYTYGIFKKRTKDVDLNEYNTFIIEIVWKILNFK